MADTGIYSLKEDLRMSMIIAAFTGISWFIGAEINTSLFVLFRRRRGLYFWSAALCSWGVILQPLFIILADFGIWTDLRGSITMIYLTWLIMVVPQSWLLYSRLHLIAHHGTMLRWIKMVLIFTSVVFSVPTIVMGTIAQATNISPGLFSINLIWDRVQLTVFFVQETALSLLYIWQARKYLRSSSLLSRPHLESATATTAHATATTSVHRTASASPETKRVLLHLVLANVLVIALDVALLGVQYADLFYLQGAFKPCVYGVKLKVEFAILNRLVEIVRGRGRGGTSLSSSAYRTPGGGGLPVAQPHIHVSRVTETKWEDEMVIADGNDSGSSVGQEQIGLGPLENRDRSAGGGTGATATAIPSRSHSHESQDRIWDGQPRARVEAVAEADPSAVVQGQPQWRQVYHR